MKRLKVLGAVVVLASALWVVAAEASNSISVTGSAPQGQSGTVALPTTIASVPVDSSYTCLWSQGNCVTSMTIAGQGVFQVDLSGDVLFQPNAGFAGTTNSVTWQESTAGQTQSETGTLTFSVALPPTVGSLAASGPYDHALVIPIVATPGAGTTLDWSAACLSQDASLTNGCSSEVSVTDVGSFTLNATQHSVSFIPDTTFTGSLVNPPVLVLDDGFNQQSVTPITPTIQAPSTLMAGPKVDSYGAAGQTQTLTPRTQAGTGGVFDDSLTCLMPAVGSCTDQVAVDSVGTYAVSAGSLVTFTPDVAWSGDASVVQVRMCDVLGSCVFIPMQVHVIAPVAGPTITGNTTSNTPVTTVLDASSGSSAGGSLITPSTRIVDPATGATALAATTSDGSWSINPTTGQILFSPRKGFTGLAKIPYVVTDQVGNVVKGFVSIHVSAETMPVVTPSTVAPVTPTTTPTRIPPPVSTTLPTAPPTTLVPQSLPALPHADNNGVWVGLLFGLLIFGVIFGGWWFLIARRRRDEEEEEETAPSGTASR